MHQHSHRRHDRTPLLSCPLQIVANRDFAQEKLKEEAHVETLIRHKKRYAKGLAEIQVYASPELDCIT